jgi:MYXO-CTERM domain-containing protein
VALSACGDHRRTAAADVEDASVEGPAERATSIVLAKPQAVLSGGFRNGLGNAIAAQGTTVLVGASATFGATGDAYVFGRSGATWSERADLGYNAANCFGFNFSLGTSVALDGPIAIVGAPGVPSPATALWNVGAAYVFASSGSSWSSGGICPQQAALFASDGFDGDRFGAAVAIVGTTAFVGAPSKNPSGAVYVFTQSGTTWSQTGKLATSDTTVLFGASAAVSGDTAVFGDPYNAGGGAAYVFVKSGATWSQQAKLVPSTVSGAPEFGASVAIDGNTIVVGAHHASGGATLTGAAFVFSRSGTTWSQQAELVGKSAVGATIGTFGESVAVHGTTAIAGAPTTNVGVNKGQGAAYLFAQSGSTWTQQYEILAADGQAHDAFGSAVALGDSYALVGAAGSSPSGGQEGSAYVFVPGHTDGDACAASADCITGVCIDGVCCDRACTNPCEACDVTGSVGTCATITGQPHGTRAPCTGTGLGTACGQACNGIDATKCIYALATTACGANACSGGTATHTGSCDFAGTCIFATSTCGAYACDTSACKTNCAANTDCAAGFHCAGTTCVPLDGLGKPCADASSCATGLACTDGVCCGVTSCGVGSSCALPSAPGVCRKKLGTTCGAAGECDSNLCVDGVCCNSACAGQCAACDGKGTEGTCTPIVGAPHGSRPACAAGSAADRCSAATCDGISATACSGLASPAVVCRVGSCTAGTQTLPANCTGKGTCEDLQTKNCAPYACGATQCKTVCASDADCASGNTCDAPSGKCVTGSTCDGDHTVTSPTGVKKDCAPLKCGGSACLTGCASTDDCVAGTTCDTATRACVEQAATASGSGCATGEGRDAGAVPALALAALAGLGRRRRRERGRSE